MLPKRYLLQHQRIHAHLHPWSKRTHDGHACNLHHDALGVCFPLTNSRSIRSHAFHYRRSCGNILFQHLYCAGSLTRDTSANCSFLPVGQRYKALIMASPPQQNSNDCAVCNQSFATSSALQQHARDSLKHAAIVRRQQQELAARQSIVCDTCRRPFGSAGALQQHQNATQHGATAVPQRLAPDPEVDPQIRADDNPWSLHPSLHEEISHHLEGDGLSVDFHTAGGFEDSVEEYDTFVMGAFTCPKQSCRTKKWTSKKIAITIHLYSGQRYNAHVWHQKCQKCKSIGHLGLDAESYIDRVVYRLRKWLGVALPVRDPRPWQDITRPPHRTELCEGCRNGHCKDMDERWQ